jgi:hypothetical protein
LFRGSKKPSAFASLKEKSDSTKTEGELRLVQTLLHRSKNKQKPIQLKKRLARDSSEHHTSPKTSPETS